MTDHLALPLPPTIPPPTQAAVEAAILGEGWTYDVEYRDKRWSTLVALRNPESHWFMEYRTFVDRSRVVLYLSREIRATTGSLKETLVLLNWINTTLECSTFELHGNDLEVRLRCTLAEDLGHRIDSETVTLLTNLAFDPDERYSPRIREVAAGTLTAQEAITALVTSFHQLSLELAP